MTSPLDAQTTESSRTRFLFGFILLLTATLSLLWSHTRLMWNDEFLSFYTDSVASFKAVVLVQLRHPISLDPPTYHLLSHLSMDILGHNAIALRLPALAGFLLFQICLFFFVRRLAGSRAAIVVMALPLLTASFRYSVDGRPYGLLLGLYALALLCWQIATIDDGIPRSRILPLTGLTLSIVLAITSHYFGVLILIPVSLGELSRIIIRKHLDFGVLLSLTLGLASIGIILPFKRALMVYRQHYYMTSVNIHDVSQGYRELFLRYTTWSILLQKLAAASMVILTLTLAVAVWKRFRHRPSNEHAYTWVALVSVALLPFFGYLFVRFVTHTMEVRYVIAALIAFTATFGIVLERRLRSNIYYAATLAVIFLAALSLNFYNIHQERRTSNKILASFRLSPAAYTSLHQNPREPIYLQTLSDFYLDTYYEPDQTLRARFSFLYGQQQEIHWLAHDTNYITAINMLHFTALSMTSYATFHAQPHPLLILSHTSWEWIGKQLVAQHIHETALTYCLRGQLVRVTNSPVPAP